MRAYTLTFTQISFMMLSIFCSAFSFAQSSNETKSEVPVNTTATDSTSSTQTASPIVLLETTLGNIKLEFYPDKAPISVENFLNYVRSGFYSDIIFHRVIPGFMIQGGGFTKDMQQKPTQTPIKNEAKNGLKNLRGTLSMARTSVVDSATSQFFLNLVDNAYLDHGTRDYGYAVFAKVVEGMDVVDAIAKVKTGNNGMHQDVPVEPVIIKSASILTAKTP